MSTTIYIKINNQALDVELENADYSYSTNR